METKTRKIHSWITTYILKILFLRTFTGRHILRFVNPNMYPDISRESYWSYLKDDKSSNILEIGTFTGYSAICLARGLKPGGMLITIEINDELKEFAQSYSAKPELIKNKNYYGKTPGCYYRTLMKSLIWSLLMLTRGNTLNIIDLLSVKSNPEDSFLRIMSSGEAKSLIKIQEIHRPKGIIEFNEMIRNRRILRM